MTLPRVCNCDSCKWCKLFHTNPKYNAIYGGTGVIKEPGMLKKLCNVTKAVVVHVASGFAEASGEEIQRRRSICEPCSFMVNGKCTECGCSLNKKAPWLTSNCPRGKWSLPMVDAKLKSG